MTTKKVSELTSASPLAGLEAIPIVQTGNSRRTTPSDFLTYIKPFLTTSFSMAISDETTALITGTAKLTFRAPFSLNVSIVKASLSVVSSSGNPTFNIKKNGATIFSTNISIDAGEKTSVTAAVPYVLLANPTAIAEDDEITIDIVTAGTGAAGAKIYLIGVLP